MKRILLFFGLLLLANILIGQTTQEDTVSVKPFEDLTLVTDGTVDTSDQLLIYDISSGTFAFRGSLGELLKKIADVQNIISTSNIVNATIENEDISGSAAISLSKLQNLSANRLVGRDTTGTGIPESLTVGYGLEMGTDRIDVDTTNEIASKDYVDNLIDDVGSGGGNASGRSLQTITADGTDTLDFGGTTYATDYWQIDLSSVTSSTLNFTNPNTSIVPTYNLHFTNASTDTVTFASTFIDANLDTITSYIFEQGQIVPVYYYNSDYYTNYLTLPTSSGGGSSQAQISPNTAEYAAILLNATNNSYTLPDTTTQRQQDILIDSLKTIGVWDSIELMYVFTHNTGLDSFSLINWKSPANFRATETDVTFSTNGIVASNSTGYVNTNFNFVDDPTVITSSAISYFLMVDEAISGASAERYFGIRDAGTSDSLFFCGYTVTNDTTIRNGIYSSPAALENDNISTATTVADQVISGTYSSGSRRSYVAGTQIGSAQTVGSPINNFTENTPLLLLALPTGDTSVRSPSMETNKIRFFILANIRDESNISRASSVLKTYVDSL